MHFLSTLKSARLLLVPAILVGTSFCMGCRRVPKQADSPTPLPEAWQQDSGFPAYPELAPPPSGNPAGEQLIPPLPEAAAWRPYDANEDFGGFTPAAATRLVAGTEPAEASSEDRFSAFAEEEEPASNLPLSTLSDSDSPFLESLDLPPLPHLEPSVSSLTEEDLNSDVPLPIAVSLRIPAAGPVSLDPLQFVIDLNADEETDTGLTVSAAPAELPRISVAPESSHGRQPAVLEWPQSGLPHGMVISPGPMTEKWAPRQIATEVPGLRLLPPQRLADGNLGWEIRRME